MVNSMRDSIKNREYFDSFITEDSARIRDFSDMLKANQISEKRIGRIKEKIFLIDLGIFIAKYSAGTELNSLCDSFQPLFDAWADSFSNSNYDANLKMLSLSILFNSEQKLTRLKQNLLETGDWLISFILDGDNDKNLAYPDHYAVLQNILKEKDYASLAGYVKNGWFDKSLDCFCSHKSTEKKYCGYWCLEVAAIIKKLGIDDSGLKNEKFYPHDLVQF